MRISVALCTRNGADFILEQAQSIFDQTLLPDELIVSDDASSDNTLAMILAALEALPADHAARKITVRILRNELPLGVTKNFEQAVTATTGELVVLCDQDDRWNPAKLAIQAARFEADATLALLFSDARLIDRAGHTLDLDLFQALQITPSDRSVIHSGEAFSVLLRRNLATGATIMFRRSLLEAAAPFPPEWVHDEWLAIIASAVARIDLIEQVLLDYRQHGANQVGVVRPTLRRKIERVFQKRGDRNAGLAARSEILAGRLAHAVGAGLPVRADAVNEAQRKASVEAFRAALPASRLRRFRPVFRAGRAGWYTRYASQGRADMLRDLLQPHG